MIKSAKLVPGKQNLFLRVVSLILVGVFCLQEISYSAPALPYEGSSTPLEVLVQDPTRFEAPLDFSTLKEIHKGSQDTFIINIQDAHSNLSGQQNLTNTLDAIMSKYDVSLVLVEGGAGDGTLTPIKKIVSDEACKRLAGSLLMEGQISGEEYLNLTSDHPMKIMGVEDINLYAKSVKSYAALADKREKTLQYLRAIEKCLDKLKAKLYPKEILNYERKSKNNDKGFEINFKELLELARAKGVSFKEFPNIQKLVAIQEKEKGIDFNAANLEQAALVEEISKHGGREDFENYLKKVSQIKNSKASQLAFFQNTFYIAKEKGISLEKYPNLILYGDYLKQFSDLDLDGVLEELSKSEDKVYVSWLPEKDARLVRAIDRYVSLLDTAYRIQMSTKDFNLFEVNEPDFSTVSYLAFINRKLVEFGYFEDIVPYQNILENGKKALVAFYDSVDKRDVAFIRNAERILKKENQKVAVLITGGYHTPHISALVREKGYSWAVLTPFVTSETDQRKYENLLLAPVRKEIKKVEVIQGESRTKSLSLLDKDLIPAQRKDDVRKPFAFLSGIPVDRLLDESTANSPAAAQVRSRVRSIVDGNQRKFKQALSVEETAQPPQPFTEQTVGAALPVGVGQGARMATSNPAPETIKKSKRAFEYHDSDLQFSGVDLEHFVHAQNRLAEKLLSETQLNKTLQYLGISRSDSIERDYAAIYEALASGRYNKEVIDLINADTYEDPRLAIEIVGQNKNPRAQSVYEAVSNSLDALGLNIGQFGKGVKQIVDWLGATGKDRIDVFTSKNGTSYQLTILRDTQEQYYIEIKQISLKELERIVGKTLLHGTVVRVTTEAAIPHTDDQRDDDHRNSQEGIAEGIHRRFQYVTQVRITTQTAENAVPREVNGFENKREIVSPSIPETKDRDEGEQVEVILEDHALMIVDNGAGMDAKTLSRMFVPKQGSKHPEFLSDAASQSELARVKVAQDESLPHRVSFARNGEVIMAVDIPAEISGSATVAGGLLLEFGSLLDTGESRDQIIIPERLKPGEISNFQLALRHMISQITSNPDFSNAEKVKYINTMIAGLEGLSEGNESYAHAIKKIKIFARETLSETISALRNEGYAILPQNRQFEKILMPQGKKGVLFVNENLFDWQGVVSLMEIGAVKIPGLTLGGERRLPLLVFPFKKDSVDKVSGYRSEWHLWEEGERYPMVKTDRFILVSEEIGKRLYELALKKSSGLTPEEEREFAILAQEINILTAEVITTSYELGETHANISLSEIAEVGEGKVTVDSKAVQEFLTVPPGQVGTPAQKQESYTILIEKAKAGNWDALWGLGQAFASLDVAQKQESYKILIDKAKAGNGYALLGICSNFWSINSMEAQKGFDNLLFDDETTSKVKILWIDHAYPMRGEFIKETREAYELYFELIPAEFREEVLRLLEPLIKALYEKQETEILHRLQLAVQGHELNLSASDLPFKIFSFRMQKITRLLEAYLTSQASSVSVEAFQDQKNYYLNLFKNLFDLATKSDLDIGQEDINERLFKSLAYGFALHSQEHLAMISRVSDFVEALEEATEGRAGLSDTTCILQFLSEAIKKKPEASGQLSRILDKKPETKKAFLNQLWRAFSSLPIKQAMDYLDSPDKPHELGAARPFVVFLSNDVPELRRAERFIPEGENVRLPDGGVEISQIMKWNQQRPKEDDEVMSVDELVENLDKLPPRSEALEAEILRNAALQREGGAYTAEITQNSLDATLGKKGELIVNFYLQAGEGGAEEYVEEAFDNGTGALKEVALLIPKSTKAEGAQIDLAGFFGTGKYTIFEGTDRVEIITRNSDGAYLFTFTVIKNETGAATAIRLTGIKRVTDEKVPQGVTVRRVKLVENTVPELDQMLSQRAWKTFAGLAQHDNFHIYFVDSEGKRQPLTVEYRVLSESDFFAVKPGEKEARNFGKFRILSAGDMPLQIVDKRGLRVRDLKEEYMVLVPAPLRKHFRELGVILQIPLPLIRNRSAFEHEDGYLPTIQKYVAAEFYKAIVHETLTQTSPQFVFEGFPIGWETNDSYWNSINTGDRGVIGLASKINRGNYRSISPNELSSLLTEPGKLDEEKKFVKLMLLLEVTVGQGGKTSLFLRRLAIQRQVEESLARAQEELMKANGYSVGKAPTTEDVPYGREKVSQAGSIQRAHLQMRNPGERIIDPEQYTSEEKELLQMATSIGKNFGIQEILLVDGDISFAGAFRAYRGKHAMFLNQRLAHGLGRDAADTIIHELAHWLKALMRREEQALWNEGFVAHSADFTHDAVGTFAEAMKYVAAVALANHGAVGARLATPKPSSSNQTPTTTRSVVGKNKGPRILKTNDVENSLPGTAVTTREEVEAILDVLLLIVASNKGVVPVGITETKFAAINVLPAVPAVNGITTIQLVDPRVVDGQGNPQVFVTLEVTKEQILEAKNRFIATRSLEVRIPEQENREAVSAVRDYQAQNSITRILLTQMAKGLTENKFVMLSVGVHGQDVAEMIKQIQELQAELQGLRETSSNRLNVFFELVDEIGNRIETLQGFQSETLPQDLAGKKVERLYSGVLSDALVNQAKAVKAGLLATQEARIDQNTYNVIPYKPDMRAGIMTAIADAQDENVRRALRTLTQAEIGVEEVKLVKEVPDYATAETYRQKNLIVKALATLSQKLYQAYVTLRAAGSSA